MFKSWKKQKEKKSSSDSALSNYKETTQVQTLTNGGQSSTIITRQISSQSSQSRTTEARTYTLHQSSSAGNVPQINSGTALSSLQTDTVPWTPRTGSNRTFAPLSGNARLPTTNLSSTFRTNANSLQPRSSLPYSSPRSPLPSSPTHRSAFNSNTFGSYPSRRPPAQLGQNAAQNPSLTTSLLARNDDVIPTYPNKCSKRGKALVINNIKFIDKKDERIGAEKDSQDLRNFLKTIGFDVDLKKDMKGKDMLRKVEEFSKSNFYSHDMSVVVIMSHGNNIVVEGNKLNRIRGGYTEIAGIDNETLLVDDIIEKFTVSNGHYTLKGKPKIFIFQCCRGDKDQEVCHDSAPIKKVTKEHSDILMAFSTLPGYLSNRDPRTGSWYIQSICEVFQRHYKDYHIEEMLKIVDDKLSTRHPQYTQTSTYESRGFKRCYLYPRGAQ